MEHNESRTESCNRVYTNLHEHRTATKGNIAYELDFSLPTVTRALTELIRMGLIHCDDTLISKKVGRNPRSYTFVPDARVAVGLDIAKNHIKGVVVDLDGTVIASTNKKIEYTRDDAYLRAIGAEVEQLVQKAKVDHTIVLGVGIAVPGIVDQEKGYVVDGKVIDNTGMTLQDFSKYIPTRTKLLHDSDAAGFSEIMKTQYEDSAGSVCYLSLCNSIGGSVFIGNNLYHGDGLYSCEIGHLNLVPGGKQCYCGKHGCFDPYCNSEALCAHTESDLNAFFDGLFRGDPKLLLVWEEYLANLAAAITEIRLMFGCKIIVGGDVGALIDPYLEDLRKKVDEENPFGEHSKDFLFPCQNKKDAIATGAAMNLVKAFLDNELGG